MNPAALKAALAGDLSNALVASAPGGIERQEAAWQAALVASANMPKDLSPSRKAFEAIGFKFGGDVDDIFLAAELPAGWTKKASGHAMWSYIHDDKGRKRVAIFYKAAFYDRSANARLERRYSPSNIYGDIDKSAGIAADEMAGAVKDGETELFRTKATKQRDYKATDANDAEVRAWIGSHFPNWTDPLAYWNED